MTHSPRSAEEDRLTTIAPAIVIALSIGAGSLLGIGFGPAFLPPSRCTRPWPFSLH